MELPKTYDPKAVEPKIYKMWLDGNYFHAVPDASKKPFMIALPPPNVTGQLHLGHAFDQTMQDILIRYKRMRGFNSLWMPGVDHAGIATQIKVEEVLRKEQGVSRHDLGREKFLEHVWDWKNKYGNRIIEQCKLLGSSCDWERQRFTMDEGLSKSVREVFVRLYEKGLIYKGSRIINWCPKCTTALSDTEVEHVESEGNLWHIKYPVKDSNEFITVATTRPETMLGDTAVAVNPNDERYKHLVGKMVILPLMDKEIPVIADEYVDMEFGTGCVKITPCHDPNDFEVAARHQLDHVLVLDGNAKINRNGGKYFGLTREDARKAVIKDLTDLGLLVKTDNHTHNVGHCSRCDTRCEPISSKQWFVSMKELAAPAIECVKNGEVKFVPERFTKIYLNWMENVRDWCVSRQLWWGHRIPAFTCEDCGEIIVAREDPTVCKCGSQRLKQEEDVLDTWFSSALWPFSTLGWPENTPELEYFYPTSVMVTGYEIIFLWVARMIFSGINYLGKPPFHTVVIHGMVRDDKGRKMSKSLGNGIDPVDIINEYGADALRMSIITGVSPGNDTRYIPQQCEAMRNFCNKLWNASRFAMTYVTEDDMQLPDESKLCLEDKWVLTALARVTKEVTDNLENYDMGIAAGKLYEFVWGELCDWYIELVKPRLFDGDATAKAVLYHVLNSSLALLHPFMPHITEEIWRTLPHKGEVLMVAAWPENGNTYAEAADMERVMDAIRTVRARRAELNVPPSKKANLMIVTEYANAFESGKAYIARLASASGVEVVKTAPTDTTGMVCLTTPAAELFLPLAELVDLNAERERREKQLVKTQQEIAALEAKLSNPGFTSKAPPKVVEAERAKLDELKMLAEKLK